MGVRKYQHKPETGPVLDSYMEEKSAQSVALDPDGFRNIVRVIKQVGLGQVGPLKKLAEKRLIELEVTPDLDLAVGGLPNGSDQVDFQTYYLWFEKVTKEDKTALRQLLALHATACVRLEG